MDLNPLALRNSFNVPDYNVALIRGRSLADWEDAFAYTVWFLVNGRVGSRADRQYLDDARANLKIRQMADSLGSYRFVDEAEEEEKV